MSNGNVSVDPMAGVGSSPRKEQNGAEFAESDSKSKRNRSSFVALIIIVDDDPKDDTVYLEDSIKTELKWRGVNITTRINFTLDSNNNHSIEDAYQSKMEELHQFLADCESATMPSVHLTLLRVAPPFMEHFKLIIQDLRDRQTSVEYFVCVIFTVGILLINDDVKTEDLDFSDRCIWIAKYLAREVIVSYTKHLGVRSSHRHFKAPPIVLFVRETPIVEQKSLSSKLADLLSMEPISFVHHRVSHLISHPDAIAHLCELAQEHGFPANDITNGCRIYLRNALTYELEASTADVIIVDVINDIYVDVDKMVDITRKNSCSTFVLEDVTDDCDGAMIDTIIWMIKRRCLYTDGPLGSYFYTDMSLQKEMDTLHIHIFPSANVDEETETRDSSLVMESLENSGNPISEDDPSNAIKYCHNLNEQVEQGPPVQMAAGDNADGQAAPFKPADEPEASLS